MCIRFRLRLELVTMIVLLSVAAPPCIASAASAIPGAWTKYASNPVLDVGLAGSWDSGSVVDPAVVFDGSLYRMWYTGWVSGQPNRIGYATSTGGTAWSRNGSSPVLSEGAAGSWEEKGVRSATVIDDGGVWKMWYSGRDAGGHWRIGYATSPDGVAWTKHGSNPVLDVGASGTWEDAAVVEATVVKVGSTYMMWYRGRVGSLSGGIGLATSTDGVTWTKWAGNPVMADPPAGSWDYRTYGPHVVYDGSLYRLWYSGSNLNDTASELGYATSVDGMHWFRQGRALQQGPDGAFDRHAADYASVLQSGAALKMWYSAADVAGKVRIGYATASMLAVTQQTFLPTASKDIGPCTPVWFDDFGDYHTGWPFDDQANYRLAYVGGEYQVWDKSADTFIWANTGAEMTDGVIAVDMRFAAAGQAGENGGILFGKSADSLPAFYRLALQRGGAYFLQRHDATPGWVTLSSGSATGYAAYPSTNRLKVVRSGNTITGYLNDNLLTSVIDSTYTGPLRFGLIVGAPAGSAGADVRFDNYGVYDVSCSGAAAARGGRSSP